jgi:outer membrane protein assembly factor BamD (BamD/ComL family)
VLSPVAYVDRANIKEELERDFARELPSPKQARERYKKYKKNMTASMPKWGSFFSSKTITDMSYQQLLQRKNELILAGDYHMAATYLEHMLKKAQNPEQIMYIMLEWGEILMHLDQMAKAETIFRDFITMYPGNEYAQLAFVKAIECSWCQTQMFERDQTKTEETLKLIEAFYTRKDHYDPAYVQQVVDIQVQCEQKLAQSKLSIIQQYITRSRYAAAHTCIKAFRDTDYATNPAIEPELLHMEILLAQAEGDKTVEQTKLQELSGKFPTHELTLALTTPKKSWWFARA